MNEPACATTSRPGVSHVVCPAVSTGPMFRVDWAHSWPGFGSRVGPCGLVKCARGAGGLQGADVVRAPSGSAPCCPSSVAYAAIASTRCGLVGAGAARLTISAKGCAAVTEGAAKEATRRPRARVNGSRTICTDCARHVAKRMPGAVRAGRLK